MDAIPCSWSSCYSDTLAKSIGIAINDDNNLLSWDGTYWKYGSLFVSDWSSIYNSNQNYAIKGNCTDCSYWNSAKMVWYNTGYSTTVNYSSATSYCSSRNMRLPELFETTATSKQYTGTSAPLGSADGVTSLSSWTWTSTPWDNHYVWKDSSSTTNRDYNGAMVKCVR